MGTSKLPKPHEKMMFRGTDDDVRQGVNKTGKQEQTSVQTYEHTRPRGAVSKRGSGVQKGGSGYNGHSWRTEASAPNHDTPAGCGTMGCGTARTYLPRARLAAALFAGLPRRLALLEAFPELGGNVVQDKDHRVEEAERSEDGAPDRQVPG